MRGIRQISTFNANDDDEVKKFKKSCADAPQETFNGMLKQYDVIDGDFQRHGLQMTSLLVASSLVQCFASIV
jgi:hypothetical protein